MKMDDAVAVWTPNTDKIRVVRHKSGWQRTSGDRWMPVISLGEFGQFKHQDKWTKLLGMFILFNTIVVRDHVDPEAVHDSFLEIDEYRAAISPDQKGATEASSINEKNA
jgi:hypothetical protein